MASKNVLQVWRTHLIQGWHHPLARFQNYTSRISHLPKKGCEWPLFQIYSVFAQPSIVNWFIKPAWYSPISNNEEKRCLIMSWFVLLLAYHKFPIVQICYFCRVCTNPARVLWPKWKKKLIKWPIITNCKIVLKKGIYIFRRHAPNDSD